MPAFPDLNLPPPPSSPESPSRAPRSSRRQPALRPIAEDPETTGSSSQSPSPSLRRPLPQTTEEVEAAARRLSFSQSPSPRQQSQSRGRACYQSRDSRKSQRQPTLPPIAEGPEHAPSPWTQPPSHPAPSAIYPMSDERQAMDYAPVVPSVLPFEPQEAVAAATAAAARELELLRYASAAALQQMQQQAWAAEAARPQLRLYTVEGNPAGYKTKWEELHPASQGLLLQIGEKMREYIYDSKQFEQLDACSRLYDPSVSNMCFELNASHITQIRLIPSTMDREKASIESLMAIVKEIMRNADFAICSYGKLRPRFVHRGAGIANAGFANRAGSYGARTDFDQPLTMAPTFHYYSGSARRPSPFMQQTVARFEKQLGECCKLIGELEQLVRMKNDKTYPDSLGSLSKVISNVYDYFIHVASEVENLHQLVETMRTQYLNNRRRRGDRSDPFLEAGRREAAKQEASARRVHPTLHLPSPIQPTAPVDAPAIASQPQQSLFPTVATLSKPLSAVRTFSIRTTPPLPNPLASTEFMLQPTPFGSASTLTLGSTPFLCGSSTPSSAALSASGGTFTFPSTPVTGGRPPRRRR